MKPEHVKMMRDEVDLLCQLDHPGVVKIFEHAFDETTGELTIVLEHLRGGDCFALLDAADGTPLSEALVSRLTCSIPGPSFNHVSILIRRCSA